MDTNNNNVLQQQRQGSVVNNVIDNQNLSQALPSSDGQQQEAPQQEANRKAPNQSTVVDLFAGGLNEPSTSTLKSLPTIVSNVIRIIVMVSCLFMIIISFPAFITLSITSEISIIMIVEFIFLFVLVSLGFYATYSKNQKLLIAYALLSLTNFAILVVLLILETLKNSNKSNENENKFPFPASYKDLTKIEQEAPPVSDYIFGKSCTVRYGCQDNYVNCVQTCCHNLDLGCKFTRAIEYSILLRDNNDNNNNDKTDANQSSLMTENLTLYILLWFIAWYCLLLSILSSVLAGFGMQDQKTSTGLQQLQEQQQIADENKQTTTNLSRASDFKSNREQTRTHKKATNHKGLIRLLSSNKPDGSKTFKKLELTTSGINMLERRQPKPLVKIARRGSSIRLPKQGTKS